MLIRSLQQNPISSMLKELFYSLAKELNDMFLFQFGIIIGSWG
jgi:hypothetical protein